MKFLLVLAFVAYASAYVVPAGYYELDYYPQQSIESGRFERSPSQLVYDTENDEDDHAGLDEIVYIPRQRRSLQPGAPVFPVPGANLPTSIGGNVEKVGPNTMATINAQHKTDNYDVGAKWSKVIRGPARSKPNFSIGGSYRW